MTQTRFSQRPPDALAPNRPTTPSPQTALPLKPAELTDVKLAAAEITPAIGRPRAGRAYLAVKRGLDLLLASVALVILAPVFAALALAIKLDSPGPVLFKQTRVGFCGTPFGMYKLRSMRTDAEAMHQTLQHLNERSGPIFKIKNDPRLTRLGRLLRKYSLDELPQLINVIRGEMSLVGPRPPLPREVSLYQPHHYRRLEATPGITGLQQVTARDESDFEEWVRLDVRYIESQSIPLDLWILLRTPLAVLSGKGAC